MKMKKSFQSAIHIKIITLKAICALFAAIAICLFPELVKANENFLPDEAVPPHIKPKPPKSSASYAEALVRWKNLEQVNHWIGEHFTYDRKRALMLSETQRNKGRHLAILSPQQLYAKPSGVCVDLARFGVQTVKKLFPELNPSYLLIEFKPVMIKGNVLRRHWLVVYCDKGSYYSFADSKRPGHIDGPYKNLDKLVKAYQKYRQRKVISYKLLSDFRKKKKRRLKKNVKSPRP